MQYWKKYNNLYFIMVKNEIYQKSAIQIFLQSFAMDLYIKWACKTVEKVAVISKRT